MVDIGALFGVSSTTTTPTIPALATFKQLVKTESQEIQKFSKLPSTQKDIAYYTSKIGKITSVDQLVKDPKLLKIVTTAYGIEEDAKYPAKIKAILNSDLQDDSSFANRLIDPRYKKFAAAFDIKINGLTRLKRTDVVAETANKYVTNAYEKQLGDKNPALREATYFLRNIGNVTDTYQILGDKVLRSVVVATLGLPENIAVQSVEKQKSLIDAKLNVLKFRAVPMAQPGDIASKSPTDFANDELSSLVSSRSAVTNAQSAVQTIADRIQDIQDDYARLAVIQDPSGPYAAEIPVQQAAAPGLARQQGLLAAGQNAASSIGTWVTRLNQLVNVVGDPANAANLAEYKTEFADLRAKISSAITNATYSYDDPTAGANYTSQNLLDGTLSGPITVTYNSAGDQTSIRTFDLSASSAFQTQLDAANAAFQAITDSTDSSNISAAANAVTSAKGVSDITSATLGVDAKAFSTAIAAVPQWAGTFDTTQLYPGAEAVRDAGSRLSQINIVISQMRSVASQAAQIPDGADHTTYTDQYADLVTQLTDLVNTTTNPGADNLLNGGDQDYQLSTDTYLKARGRDLATSVTAVLAAGDLSDSTGANAVLSQLNGAVNDALTTASREIGVDSQVFSLAADTLDPRAKVDSAYRKLATDIASIQAGGAAGETNLLDATQDPITLNLSSITRKLTLSPKDFDTDIADILETGSQLLPSDTGDISGALARLDEARFNVQRMLGHLSSDLNQIDNARSALNQKITDLSGASAKTDKGLDTAFSNASNFAVQFIQRYLALKDSQDAATASGISGGANAYLTQLIKPITIRGGGLNTSA